MSLVARWQTLTVLVSVFVVGSYVFARQEEMPDRLRFSLFPKNVAEYTSIEVPVDNKALELLRLTDYLSRVYSSEQKHIGAYVGYHGFQRQGSSIHSPLNCLPGGGWTILKREFVPMPGTDHGPTVNRLTIGNGNNRQLVYYWYQGRGRVMADEKIALLRQLQDVAVKNRSDAALVRFIMAGEPDEVEATLSQFIPEFTSHLPAYVPE